jgi:putative transposase
MKDQLIQAEAKKATSTSISQLCETLSVNRSSYYRRRKAAQAASCPRKQHMMLHLKVAFQVSQQTYGSRRLRDALRQQGYTIGRYKIRRLMKECQLKPVWQRQWIQTTDSNHSLPVADNLLNRQFNPTQMNEAWVSDITYIRTGSGWLYLAAVMDLYSRKIIGWAMSATMNAELVCQALRHAVQHRQPQQPVLVHSDQGSQYASHAYRQLLQHYGFRQSMSRKANCWDNAVMERFFLNLKMERVWHKQYANHLEARQDVTDYICAFYNTIRLHSNCRAIA